MDFRDKSFSSLLNDKAFIEEDIERFVTWSWDGDKRVNPRLTLTDAFLDELESRLVYAEEDTYAIKDKAL